MLLPALTLSVIPTGIIARTVRSQVADILSQEFIVGLRARGLNESRIFVHVSVKNAAHRAGGDGAAGGTYLMGGSILVETVFLAGNRIAAQYRHFSARPAPAAGAPSGCWRCFSCCSTLLVDILQTTLDPRIKRS
ncbi:ABC transporter permease subunit [Klebsiella pneumoniae subsp. pneumoniae]|nr:ABC transporter permease subunit [Klebsiella pneumoniae subsp. pneumoniae]